MYHPDSVPRTPNEVLATFPEGRRFDIVDLWQLTGALCAELPGVAITSIARPFSLSEEDGYLGTVVTWNDTNTFPSALFPDIPLVGQLDDLWALRRSVIKVMGVAQQQSRYGLRWMRDLSPEHSPDPEEQRRLASIFLEQLAGIHLKTGRLALTQVNTLPANRLTAIKRQASLNLRLARFANQPLRPYRSILARSQNWTMPGSIPPSFTWLIGQTAERW